MTEPTEVQPQQQPEPAATEPAQPTQPAQQTEPQKSPTAAERRISQLFAQKREAEERASAAESRIDALRSELLQLQDQVASFKGGGQGQDTFPTGTEAQQYSGTPDVEAVFDKKLKEFEARITQGQRQRELELQTRQAQQHFFNIARQEFPEIADVNSQLHKLADKLFMEQSPTGEALRRDPQGPYRAVLMARGILSDSAAPAPTPEQKAAAAGGPATGPAGDVGGKKTEIAQLSEQIEALQDRQRRGDGDAGQLHVAVRNLQLKRARLEGRLSPLPPGVWGTPEAAD